MQTRAAQYEAAARRFRDLADELLTSSDVVARSVPLTIPSGGALRRAIDETTGVVLQQCRTARSELDRLARVCAFRASVCRVFEAQWATYERHHREWVADHADGRGRPPASPPVPAAWVLP